MSEIPFHKVDESELITGRKRKQVKWHQIFNHKSSEKCALTDIVTKALSIENPLEW